MALVVSARILLSISCEEASTLLFWASTLTLISLLFTVVWTLTPLASLVAEAGVVCAGVTAV